jgi:hypothetical protein
MELFPMHCYYGVALFIWIKVVDSDWDGASRVGLRTVDAVGLGGDLQRYADGFLVSLSQLRFKLAF